MSVLIKHMAMPKGCMYANDKDQTEYCPLLNHDDVPFCQYIENEPEIAIGIDERPVYCPLSDVPEPCQDTVSRQAAIDALEECADRLQMVNWKENPGVPYKAYALNWCINTIRDLPSAQPEYRLDEWCTDCKEYDTEKHCCPRFNQVIRMTLSERKKGKWIYKNDLKQFFCSECGYPSLTYDDTYIYGMDLPNYCEDCGADMRGGQDEWPYKQTGGD